MRELLAPEKPIIIDGRRKRRFNKFFLLLASIASVGALIGFKFHEAHNLEKARQWKTIDMPQLGLKFKLKTNWSDGVVKYIFLATTDTEDKGHLETVLKAGIKTSFVINLLDQDGFIGCTQAPRFHRLVGKDGNYNGFDANGSFDSCTEEHYRKSTTWHPSFTYPAIGVAVIPPVRPEVTVPPINERLPHISVTKTDDSYTDTVTGADFVSGEIDTLSGKTFRVSRTAEKQTLLDWKSTDRVTIVCGSKECLIMNQNGQAVHAARAR